MWCIEAPSSCQPYLVRQPHLMRQCHCFTQFKHIRHWGSVILWGSLIHKTASPCEVAWSYEAVLSCGKPHQMRQPLLVRQPHSKIKELYLMRKFLLVRSLFQHLPSFTQWYSNYKWFLTLAYGSSQACLWCLWLFPCLVQKILTNSKSLYMNVILEIRLVGFQLLLMSSNDTGCQFQH